MMETISVKELYQLKQKGDPVIVLDVRTQKEYDTVHITDAMLEPIDQLDPKNLIDKLKNQGAKNPKIYVACATGVRAGRACNMFLKADYPDVVLIEGGTVAWDEAGYPVQRNISTMPLQQQIKLFQGGAVVVGSLFGILSSSAFLLVPLMVGGEMIYAARTGNSILSGIFARMPWNL